MKLLLFPTDGELAPRVIADSAVGRTVQPWFLPDFGTDWRWRRALALRVSRLGKGISSGFLSRYVDAVTLLWVAEARDCPALDFMDQTVVCGKWLPLTADVPEDMKPLLIESAKYATLKNGDIIARMLPVEPENITPGSQIILELENEEIIKFNIK